MIAAIAIVLSFIFTDPYPRNPSIDIKHYTFRLELNDTTNVIAGLADVTVLFRQPVSEFSLNLVNKNTDGLGMTVFGVTTSGKPVAFRHQSNLLTIQSPSSFRDTATFRIAYGGIPIDGLVIGKNKFGDRTFFGDNWPDRGHNWLPTIDHPYEKATVDFVITAPDHYQVVATGERISEKKLTDERMAHHWHASNDVAVKVMTIGVARFAIQQSGTVEGIPVSTWVFPQNDDEGFADFSVAPRVLKFMQDYIGPYPYEKLAHVQSRTRFGGLENASNIFYFENSVNGKQQREGLIAHETAHQWFGNSVTENDWHHVWLSEGFATYFSALYLGATYGEKRLMAEMIEDRQAVIKFYEKQKTAIIDTTITDIDNVLNTNTYQKAAWFLHMLRVKVGADAFQKGVRSYYHEHRDRNATTEDFLRHMEAAAEEELDSFFSKWLYWPGYPQLRGTWTYDKRSKTVLIQIRQNGHFIPLPDTDIEVLVQFSDGRTELVHYPLYMYKGAADGKVVEAGQRPVQVVMDPNTKLLFQGEMVEKP